MLEQLPANSRVVIVDSSAILKSCFEGYKAPRTSTYKGRALDVAGLYGYLYRTLKIYKEFEFEALVHVIDPPGGSYYRYSMYPDYKGNRKEDDPVFAAHKALLAPALEAFGERYIRMRGVESDDVIATLADRCADLGHRAMIISPDKDLLQLVRDDAISVARYIDMPMNNGQGKFKTYDIYETEAEVTKKLGVRPDQIADFLAIVGDTADNIPGVHKAGPKTAEKWLSDHGDLVTLMTNAHTITGKIGEYLRDSLDKLPLYQKLTNVLRDVPGVDLPPAGEPDPEAHAMFRELLLLTDDFPSRFVVGGGNAYVPPKPIGQASAPVQAPAPVMEKLEAPLADVLGGPAPNTASSDVLGALFGGDAPTSAGDSLDPNDPFSSLGLTDAPASAFPVQEPEPATPPPPTLRTGRPGRLA